MFFGKEQAHIKFAALARSGRQAAAQAGKRVAVSNPAGMVAPEAEVAVEVQVRIAPERPVLGALDLEVNAAAETHARCQGDF